MTLDQLRIFVTVAELLHVTRAAAALNMTQSAASSAIQALETRVGLALFNRVGRHIELTEAGRLLLPEAKAVLARLHQAEQVLADLHALDRGRLSLSASQTIAGYWLPPFIVRFRQAFPRIDVSMTIGNTTEVARAVLAGEAELGFVEGEVDDPLLVRIDVGTDQLILVSARDQVLPDALACTAEALARLPWVLREPGSGTRQVFEEAMRTTYGIDPATLTVALELPSNEAVRSAVEAGGGVTVISRHVAAARIAAGTLIEQPIPFPQRRFVALRHGDRHRSRAEAAFLDLIRRTTDRAAAETGPAVGGTGDT